MSKNKSICNYCETRNNCKYLKDNQHKKNKIELSADIIYSINNSAKDYYYRGLTWADFKRNILKRYQISGYLLDKLKDFGLVHPYIIQKNKMHKNSFKIPDETLYTRTYKDFKSLNLLNYAILDTVESLDPNGPTLITLMISDTKLVYIDILPQKTSYCVVASLNKLEYILGSELFSYIFPVILTDTGYEFIDRHGMEDSINGGFRTTVYYADTGNKEKGALENRHRFIRKLLPLSVNFDFLNSCDINYITNIINSVYLESLVGIPFILASEQYPAEFLDILELKLIEYPELVLTPNALLDSMIEYYCY